MTAIKRCGSFPMIFRLSRRRPGVHCWTSWPTRSVLSDVFNSSKTFGLQTRSDRASILRVEIDVEKLHGGLMVKSLIRLDRMFVWTDQPRAMNLDPVWLMYTEIHNLRETYSDESLWIRSKIEFSSENCSIALNNNSTMSSSSDVPKVQSVLVLPISGIHYNFWDLWLLTEFMRVSLK